MGRYRDINVDLNRQYRNDLNQNFTDIERDIIKAESEIARVEAESKERDNLLAGTDVEAIIQRIDTSANNADVQAQHAKTQGDYAKSQGDYAKSQGEYAQSKGDYANEKAILADQAAATANTESSNLSQLKIDVTTATQNANTATSNANTARTNANNAATYANAQGDYAKREADRVASMDVAALQQQVTQHLGEDATTTKKGHVQLNDATNSTSVTQAATANAVKKVNDSLTTHFAESSGKHIHSSGSNANGHWIKFDDGTMICRVYKASFELPNHALANSTGDNSLPLPATFANSDVSSMFNGFPTNANGINLNATLTKYHSGNGNWAVRVYNNSGTAITRILDFMAIAIGRWK